MGRPRKSEQMLRRQEFVRLVAAGRPLPDAVTESRLSLRLAIEELENRRGLWQLLAA